MSLFVAEQKVFIWTFQRETAAAVVHFIAHFFNFSFGRGNLFSFFQKSHILALAQLGEKTNFFQVLLSENGVLQFN